MEGLFMLAVDNREFVSGPWVTVVGERRVGRNIN